MSSMEEHPFAQYVRTLGKGRKGSRGLSRDEARDAFGMILDDQVEPEQLGAFLMLMRVKEETAEEVAGTVEAIRQRLDVPALNIDLDWSSYAGKRRHLPWFILSNLLLAANGLRIFMHGATGHTAGRIYTRDVLPQLGVQPATSLDEAAEQIERDGFAYLDLEHLQPRLHRIINLRPLLGLRSPVHTIARMLNPFAAPAMVQGIFHPGYQKVHQEAAQLLGQPHMAVLKGEGGEIERNPEGDCRVDTVHDGQLGEELWPTLLSRRQVKDEQLEVSRMQAVWRGEDDDPYARAATIGTAAIALKVCGRATSVDAAQRMAEQMWQERDTARLG